MPVADDVGSGHLASRVRRLLTSAPVLAIDLGKYKCVACVDRSATEHTFQTMDTSRIARLISRTRPAVVVIEACSLAGWVHDVCDELGVQYRVANTAAEAWKYKHTNEKPTRGRPPPGRPGNEMSRLEGDVAVAHQDQAQARSRRSSPVKLSHRQHR